MIPGTTLPGCNAGGDADFLQSFCWAPLVGELLLLSVVLVLLLETAAAGDGDVQRLKGLLRELVGDGSGDAWRFEPVETVSRSGRLLPELAPLCSDVASGRRHAWLVGL